MKRGPKTVLSNRVKKMSIQELIMTILILLALITLLVMIALVIGQNTNGGDGGIGWIARLGLVLL